MKRPSLQIENYGNLTDGTLVKLYTLTNANGMEVGVINYGGIIVSLKVPDKKGVFEDVVLGFDSLQDYIDKNPYFGCLVGRFGNRIAKGKFSLEGIEYSLPINNGENHLHGGIMGFDKVFWNIEVVTETTLKLSYTSMDGEQGYPGTLTTEVLYELTEANEVKIKYKASTDKQTIVNLTHHSYFNLKGAGSGDILQHHLQMNATGFVEVNENLIPTGQIRAVENTVFDFSSMQKIATRINKKDEQLILAGGFDHTWVVNEEDDGELKLAAILAEERSGRLMEVYTTEPGIQFYSGNFLDGTLNGKNKIAYPHRSGLCLETQHFPDAPNQKHFPSVVLNPGEIYESETVYAFKCME